MRTPKKPDKPKVGTPEFRAQAKRRLAENRAGFITADNKLWGNQGLGTGKRLRRTVSTGKAEKNSIDLRSPGFVAALKGQWKRATKKKKP